MPIKFDIDYSKDIVVFTAVGDIVFKDVIEILDAYLKAGLVHYEIIDISRGTIKNFTLKQMDQIIEWGEKHNGKRPEGIEGEEDITWRKDLLRKIGYKL